MLSQDPLTEGLDFAEGDCSESARSFEAEGESTNPAEEVEDIHSLTEKGPRPRRAGELDREA